MRAEAHVHIGKARKGDERCVSLRFLPNDRVQYVSYLRLRNVKFSVQPAGLAKFRTTGQKNVHAFVRGDYVVGFVEPIGTTGQILNLLNEGYREAGYNPRANDTFIGANGEQLFKATDAVLIGKRLFYRQ